jgi:hypothetical protein
MRSVFYACFALCLGLAASMAIPATVSAAPQSSPAIALKDFAKGSPATSVTYRHYCVRQYFKCRHHTESGWEFRQCMKWKGCWEAYVNFRERHSENSCGQWREACAQNWGYGGNDYYGCLRYHGCE